MPDAGCIPAYRIRLGGVESHKKREKCNTSFFQAMKHEFVPPERGFLLENRRFVAQHKVGKHERTFVVEVIAVDEQIQPID